MQASEKRLYRSLAFAFALLVGTAISGPALAEGTASVSVETLLKTDAAWDGTRYAAYPSGQPQITVQKIQVPAHSSLPWHTHSMPIAGYVVSGELTVEKTDGEKKTVRAGQVLPETVGSVHRGVTGAQPVTLIVFYAGVDGMPLAQKQ